MIKNPIQEIIERVVRSHLAGLIVESVQVRRDRDADGDDVLRIIVVYNEKSKIDVKKIKSLVHQIYHEIKEIEAFPIISFRSLKDHRRLSEAA